MNEIKKINIKDIDSFKKHPFLVNVDVSLYELADSIKENGLLNPIVVRKKQKGRYELISGHRRKLAMELIGMTEVEACIKQLNDDDIIFMVDSNMHREKILPSEKAFAYKMKLDAMKHQGRKITSAQVVLKLTTKELIGKQFGDSREQVRRYIRLTYLIPELLEIVDNTVKYDKRTYLTMGLTTAVELSYLNVDEQNLLYNTIIYEDLTPSYAQALKIRELSKKKLLDFDSLEKY